MIAKEWRDAWWKLLAAAVAVVPSVLIVAEYLPPYRSSGRVAEEFSPQIAVNHLSNVYSGGATALGSLAALLGVALVSKEAARGTIFLLLSRPVGRTRVLLTKYAVCAGILLAAAASGQALLLVVAFATKGYPPGLVTVSGVVLSTVLVWLGSLPVLGAALIFSVVFRNATASVAGAALVFFAYWFFAALGFGYQGGTLYAGPNLAPTDFLVGLTAAALPLLAALWLFRRRAY